MKAANAALKQIPTQLQKMKKTSFRERYRNTYNQYDPTMAISPALHIDFDLLNPPVSPKLKFNNPMSHNMKMAHATIANFGLRKLPQETVGRYRHLSLLN